MVMGSYNLSQQFTWVNAVYGVHPGLEITGAEVVCISVYLPHNIWMYLFMEPQGYDPKQNILSQQNNIMINMENNGEK